MDTVNILKKLTEFTANFEKKCVLNYLLQKCIFQFVSINIENKFRHRVIYPLLHWYKYDLEDYNYPYIGFIVIRIHSIDVSTILASILKGYVLEVYEYKLARAVEWNSYFENIFLWCIYSVMHISSISKFGRFLLFAQVVDVI